jgi:hypothetical protein
MYGVVAKCKIKGKQHEHLLAVGNTYMDAWGNVPSDIVSITAQYPNVTHTIRLRKADVERMRKDKKFAKVGGLN